MSSLDQVVNLRPMARRAFCAALASSLIGCGFQPLYRHAGTHNSSVVSHLAAVSISPIPDRQGQILRNALLDRLTPYGSPKRALYRLDIALDGDRSDLVILRDATSTFAKVGMQARFLLTDLASGQPLTRGKSESTTIFNIVESEFANLNADAAARERAVRQISEEIHLKLGAFFKKAIKP